MKKNISVDYKYASEEVNNIFVTYNASGGSIDRLRSIIQLMNSEIPNCTIDGIEYEFEFLHIQMLHDWECDGDGEVIYPYYEIVFTNKD